jgi:hypothetical protein
MAKFLEFHGPLAFRRNLYFQHKERRTTGTGTIGGISDDIRDTALMSKRKKKLVLTECMNVLIAR